MRGISHCPRFVVRIGAAKYFDKEVGCWRTVVEQRLKADSGQQTRSSGQRTVSLPTLARVPFLPWNYVVYRDARINHSPGSSDRFLPTFTNHVRLSPTGITMYPVAAFNVVLSTLLQHGAPKTRFRCNAVQKPRQCTRNATLL